MTKTSLKPLKTVSEIVLILGLNHSDKSYLEHKYSDMKFTEKEWRAKLKKDKLDFKV